MNKQTFFLGITHYSPDHEEHKPPDTLVATEWFLAKLDSSRSSGYSPLRDEANNPMRLGHSNFNGQTTLPTFTERVRHVPDLGLIRAMDRGDLARPFVPPAKSWGG